MCAIGWYRAPVVRVRRVPLKGVLGAVRNRLLCTCDLLLCQFTLCPIVNQMAASLRQQPPSGPELSPQRCSAPQHLVVSSPLDLRCPALSATSCFIDTDEIEDSAP